MAFVVEAPGAALPFSFPSLLNTLEAANSHDYGKRQTAGEQLSSSSWKGHADYYPTLQSIFLDNSLPREVRFLAIIQLKNGIDSYWRGHSVKAAIPTASKQLIRSRLFRGSIDEPDSQLALHNAIVTAKIVRIDFPTDWSTVLDELISLLQALQNDSQTLAGALLIVLRVVKELGAARLMKTQRALQAVVPKIVQVLGEIYDAKTKLWLAFLTSGHGDESSATAAMGNSLTALKILRRILIVGYEDPYKDEAVRQIWSYSHSQFGQFAGLVNDKYPAIGEHLLQFTKLHNAMASSHQASFAALPGSADLVRSYWNLVAEFSEAYDQSNGIRQGTSSSGTRSKAEGPLLERFALKGLLLIRACVSLTHRPILNIRYRSKEGAQEQQEAIHNLKTQLFSDEFVSNMVNIITTRLLVFRKADVDAWEEDPQEWELQEESQGNAYEWEVRPCAERLFLDLVTGYKSLLLPPLLSYFVMIKDPQASVVTKESVYTVMGLAAGLVEGQFDFDSLITSVIATDAVQAVPMCQILRRRIAILLSQWVPVKSSDATRPLIYEIFKHLLNSNDPHNDIVVRITAARQFKTVVDELHFDAENFLPHASEVLRELINLAHTVEHDETKLAIIETLRALIARMDTSVTQFSDLIMDALPAIWSSAGDLGFMMKQAVLTILLSLAIAMRTDSQRYHNLMLPLIAEATQPGSDSYLYLIDDALELWTNLLRECRPPLSPDLLNLAGVAIQLLADQTEHANSCIAIVGSYIALAPQSLFEDHYRQPLLKSLSASLESGGHELLNMTTKYIEMTIRLSHQLGGEEGFQLLARDLMETGFLKHILEVIHDSFEAHGTSGPKRKQSRVGPLGLTSYFTILARVCTINPSIFVAMLETLGSLESVWAWLSAEWFLSFDSMAETDRLKLNLLGITRLLELPQPMANLALTKLQDYMSMWTSVIGQIWEADAPGHDGLYSTEKPSPTQWDTYKDLVERELLVTDPVRTVFSHSFVKERLQGLSQTVGEQTFQEWLGNVDGDVLSGFQELDTR
ncbi:putative importin 11 [Xylaria sp. CBS 124048]|nr:putative importin 11 [Xylaria sp. CBS 124048]